MKQRRSSLAWSAAAAFLLVLLGAAAVVDACFITNCPEGGKKRAAGLLLQKRHYKQCSPCGPGGLGRCFGPDLCCLGGDLGGCYVGTAEAAACAREDDSFVPCRNDDVASCDSVPRGQCVTAGRCCNEQGECRPDGDCQPVRDETASRRRQRGRGGRRRTMRLPSPPSSAAASIERALERQLLLAGLEERPPRPPGLVEDVDESFPNY